MKTKIILLLVLAYSVGFSQTLRRIPAYDYGMNCDNTYRDRTGETFFPSSVQEGLQPASPQDLQFWGEYQIFLRKMGIDPEFLKAITIEAVSFPFVPDFGNLTFIPGSSPRNCLVLDTESSDLDTNVVYDAVHSSGLPCLNFYDNIPASFKSRISPNKRWNEVDYVHTGIPYSFNVPVYLKFSQSPGYCTSSCHINGGLNAVNAWSALVSKFFADSRLSTASHPYTVGSGTGYIYVAPRIIFPHTVLKHTFWVINLGDTLSYSYIVDWTRGIFRTYPFTKCGEDSDEAAHDISMDAWIMNRVIPDQHDTTCSAVGYVTNAGTAPDSLEYLYPPKGNSNVVKFELTGADVDSQKYPLGYTLDNGTPALLTPRVPPAQQCAMQYFIDKSIDLTKINPVEKVIYHPSETVIKSGVNLVFPSCYLFRTVRSTYPKASDMANLDPNNPNGWNSIRNGGPYQDLREIPVPTDLSTTADPNDASVYIIENGATLVLQDGVTVYDCTFKVKPGGNIVNYDSKDVAGRFKIQWLDGSNNVINEFAMHRGRVQKQFIHLQNLTIDADVIFEGDIIQAGDNIGVTVTPSGNRIVTFKAVNEVKLGANFKANPRGNGAFYSKIQDRCNKNTSAMY